MGTPGQTLSGLDSSDSPVEPSLRAALPHVPASSSTETSFTNGPGPDSWTNALDHYDNTRRKVAAIKGTDTASKQRGRHFSHSHSHPPASRDNALYYPARSNTLEPASGLTLTPTSLRTFQQQSLRRSRESIAIRSNLWPLGRPQRLPFDLQNIASTHADLIRSRSRQLLTELHQRRLVATDKVFISPSRLAEMGPLDLSTGDSRGLGLRGVDSGHHSMHSLPNYSFMLTPPDDNGSMDWTASAQATEDTPTTRESHEASTNLLAQPDPLTHSSSNSDAGESKDGGDDRELQSASNDRDMCGNAPSSMTPRLPTPQSQEGANDGGLWFEPGIKALVSSVDTSNITEPSVRVLSQALPFPCSNPTVFPSLINAINNVLPPGQTTWINAVHAVPPRFSLADLPSSPPGTPGMALAGDDYFSSVVFNSAVPVQDARERGASTPIPASPFTVVPPSSMHLGLVERYIPPSHSSEISDLFSAAGPSILVDRLAELSPDGGSLLFIYPTRQGAQTFSESYLGPILDPALRSLVVVNELTADLGIALGAMQFVDELPTYEVMTRKMRGLCQQLNRESTLNRSEVQPTTPTTAARSTYSLVHSSKQEVLLERKVWANWWIHQEKGRLREGLGRYFRKARKFSASSDVNPTHLLQELLDAVLSRPYDDPPSPTMGVEVGVFVIRRCS